MMKKKTMRLFALLMALVLTLCMTACGGSDDSVDGENVYKLGDFRIEYKGATISPDDDGVDSVILALDFTNNSKSAACYGFNLYERGEQAGEIMYVATLSSIADEGYYKEAEPGETVEVFIGFNLNAVDYQGNKNYTDEVKVTITEVYGEKECTITIDPTTLSVEEGAGGSENSDSGDAAGAAAGGTDGFGDFASIMIPEEFTFERDSWNEENPHFVSVKKSDWVYFDFHNYTDEESMRKDYEYNKKTYTNEQTDVSANYGGIDWTGFQYGDGMGGYGFEVYAIMGSNYLKVSSAGLAFDNETAVAVLGSVVMADGSGANVSGTETAGTETSGTEVIGVGANGVMTAGTEAVAATGDWLSYWTGEWYGWWLLTDGTGIYADIEDGLGAGIWDACARIEAYEDMTGYMELWDSDGSSMDLVAGITLGFANPDDTKYGVMSCKGGQFLSDMLEDGDWYVNPDDLSYENIFDFRGEYEDEYGTFSYRVLLRPWGFEWDDLGEEFYPEFYYDWYMPLVEAGEFMPDAIG